MLEKLKSSEIGGKTFREKINELVVAVNKLETMAKNTNTVLESLVEENNIHEKQIDELQTKVNKLAPVINFAQPKAKDKFAEQCKWLGKLCKFWDGDEQMSHLRWGILSTITPTSPVPYCCSLGDGKTFDYEHCEPVLPNDDIIYKGGDNE